ncbi:MAG TPA: M6 family metalloprotease domain-containing protein [Candidatus Cloacimonadota bacterium]|nr:M6 family metalloprotease domain-containing protein [Candidatus Cloacimonadota bacterium]
MEIIKRKNFVFSLVLILLAYGIGISMLEAAYLSKMPVSVMQPDGKELSLFASGDEYHNWLHDEQGYTIIRDSKTGFLCYAQNDGEEVVASNLVVGRDEPLNLSSGINISEEAYRQRRNSRFEMPVMRDAPTIGTINNIVVYIRFSGESEFGQPISTYEGWFNSDTSSQKNYFLEASFNKLTVNTTFYPAASGAYVVSWQSSNPRSYYQPYDATTNPNGYNGDTQRRDREFTLLQNAISGVEASVPAGLNLDSDNDGRVDNVVFIVSGSAGAWSSLLWPHRWAIWDRLVYLRGKRVYDFNLQLKDFLQSQNVGVICHEFFHTLGAPDLYHYSSDSTYSPVGSWDIMQSNTNPPQHMGAYMKYKYGKWIAAPETISMNQEYTLNPVTSEFGSIYRINSNDPSQYYVVEYRRKMGTFENQIPGSGLLVYRINPAYDGNADGPPDEVYLYRPNGTTTVNGSLSSAHFSQEAGRTSINNGTNPAPFLQDGGSGNLSIYSIGSASGSTISFALGMPVLDFVTNPYTESFESSVFPPAGWTIQTLNGTYQFQQVSSGTNPNCSPYYGSRLIQYNSYNASSGHSAYLSSLALDLSDSSVYEYKASFRMYRDPGYSSRADRIEVYLNTMNNLEGSPVLLGTINRSTILSPVVASEGWYEYSYTFPPTDPGLYYVIFKAVSEYGNRMYLDNVVFSRLVKLPLMQAFDALVAPELPSSFSSIVVSSTTSAYIRSYTNANYSISGSNSLIFTNSSDSNADLRFVSPEITSGISNTRISFYARGSDGYILQIGTMSSPDGAFTLFQSLALSSVYQHFSISMTAYSGSNKYLAIKHGLGGTYRSIYIDDIHLEPVRNRDLRAYTIRHQPYGFFPESQSVSLSVENRGKLSANGFRVRLIDHDTGTEIVGVNESTSLSPGSSRSYDLSFTPSSGQPKAVYAQVQYGIDEYQTDNLTEVEILPIYPAEAYQSNVGNHGSYNTANSMPFNFYWKNSLAEVVLLADELRIASGNLEGICLPYSFVQDIWTQPLKIWTLNTDATNLSSGWLSAQGYTLVFDDTVSYESGQNLLFLRFNTPFLYSGQNLALRFNRPMDIRYYNSSNHFLYSADQENPSRCRYMSSDSTVYDPLNPTTSGTLSNNIPVMSLVISGVWIDAPQPTIRIGAQGPELHWEAVRGADQYLLSTSTQASDWSAATQTAITGTSFTETAQSSRFYRLKAQAIRQPMFQFSRAMDPIPPEPEQDCIDKD